MGEAAKISLKAIGKQDTRLLSITEVVLSSIPDLMK